MVTDLKRKFKKDWAGRKGAILEFEEPAHLNGTTKRDLPITLREMHVTHGKVGSFDEDREINLATSAQVLDVAVASVLSPGNGSACFRCDSLPILASLLHLRNISPPYPDQNLSRYLKLSIMANPKCLVSRL